LANNFNKHLLTRFIDSECERQLFLDLAQIKPEFWYTDSRKIIPPKRIRKSTNLLLLLGKKYEQKVYSPLISLKGAKYSLNSKGKVDDTYLNPNLFMELYKELRNSAIQDLILLEYQFDVPESVFLDLFPPKKKGNEIPVNYSDQRPDIMILGNSLNKMTKSVKELLVDGTIREVPESELKTRYGINIIDIKNIREDNIGKKQFIEIFYYLWTLVHYLHEHGLSDKYFVRIDYNGILPQLTDENLKKLITFDEVLNHSLKIKWDESFQVFIDCINKIKKLWKKSPCSIESTHVNIQPSCGYCYFIEDCKNCLGIDGKTPRKDWSIRLIPYTSFSVAQQLEDLKKVKKIGDLAAKIDSFNDDGELPAPLYIELPLLALKSKALIDNSKTLPLPNHTHSYSIPKYSAISITFAVEFDPSNQRVYAAAFYLDMSPSPKAQFSGIFNNWWSIWKKAIENNWTSTKIQKELNDRLIRPIPLEEVDSFLSVLNDLKKIRIYLQGSQTKSGGKRKLTHVIYQFGLVNKDYMEDSEAKFTVEIIKKLYSIFELCNIVENYVVSDGYKPGSYFGPVTSLFYWSKRQLNNFQNMLERNLNHLIDNIIIWRRFLKVISLFTPSDSEVTHPYQHKKLFNVQDFAETIFGFPTIISYTWHEIAKLENITNTSLKYWIPHFNFMDFNNWYEMILIEDKEDYKEKKKEILKQIMHKVRTINNLRKRFQIESRFAISKHSIVASKEQFRRTILPSGYHSIAQVWYLFSKLTGSMEEMDTEYLRTIYPEFSIGKLAAARVSNLKIYPVGEKKFYYTFSLLSRSSNMKISEKDRVLLIPNEKRDMRTNRRIESWKIVIKEITWNSTIKGYDIKTESTGVNLFENVSKDKEIPSEPKDLEWYLYPTALDVWSKKLYAKDGLLQRENFGRSWLGALIAYNWKIRSKQELLWPKSWKFSTPEIYLYAPKLLLEAYPSAPSFSKDLLTTINPYPDKSQNIAINSSLNAIISGIQGPPGTGKSQTIAALVDEFYHRCLKRGKTAVKILITSFSYAAIRVLIDKIREGKDNRGGPTKTSKLQMIFLRSEHQDPISPKSGVRNVDDLVRSGSTWKLNGQSHSVTKTKLLNEHLNDSCIIFANAHQLYYLRERIEEDFSFDLICVDEASQMPVDYFMASLQYIHKYNFVIEKPLDAGPPDTRILDKNKVENLKLIGNIDREELTKVVIVGDYNQLPPVQPVKPPKNLEIILESLFGYYVKTHQIPNNQLKINYRSHKDIVEFTSRLGIYKDLKPHPKNANKELQGNLKEIKNPWVKIVLDPKKVVTTIIHNEKYRIGISAKEANIVGEIIKGYYEMINPDTPDEERIFWSEKIGVVAPHNAQGRLIIRKIYDQMTDSINTLTKLPFQELMNYLKNTIYSVEKFQGSDRELIISSVGLSDMDQLSAESDFIYNLNRFNVLTSRAKCKVIFVASKRFLRYIPRERKVMEEAAHIRRFAYEFCNTPMKIKIKNKKGKEENIELRYKS